MQRKRAIKRHGSAERLSEKKFKALIENAHEGIVLYDTEGRIKYASPSVKKICGYTEKELLGRKGTDFLHPDDVDEARRIYYSLKPGKSVTFMQRVRHKKGNHFWAESRLTNFWHVPEINGVVSNFRDITETKRVEEKIFQTQKILESISNNISYGIFRGILGKEFQFANRTFLAMIGLRSLDQLKNIKPRDIYGQETQQKEFFKRLRKKGSVENEEVWIKKKNGKQFLASFSATLLYDKVQGELFVGTLRDITKEKEAEQKLRQSELLVATISKNINEGIYRSSVEKGLIYVNESFARIFGYSSPQEILKVNPKKLYHDLRVREKLLEDLEKQGRVSNREVMYVKKNGELFWGLMSSTLHRSLDGKHFIDGAVRDITLQKEAEKTLLDSRNFLNNVINTVAAPIFVKDDQHRWIMFNESFCSLIGRRATEILFKSDPDFLRKDQSKIFWRIDDEVLLTGKTIHNEEQITGNDGKTKDVITTKTRFINEKGEKFVIGFISDITERKASEEMIRSINANLTGVLESTRDRIIALDKNFRYVTFNKSHAESMRRLTGSDIGIGDCILDILPDEWAESMKREGLRALKGQPVKIERVITLNEIIEVSYNPIRDENNAITGFALFIRDITERKKFEEIVKTINASLRGILESTTDHIVALDKDYCYISFNQAHAYNMKKMFGKEARKGESLFNVIPEELHDIARRDISRALGGEQFTSEIDMPNRAVMEVSYNPIQNEKEDVRGVAIFARDISSRKVTEAKLKALNEELTAQNWQLASQEEDLKTALEELSERNFELDQLMYKTSHDLRSPLSSIMGLVNLANLDKEPDRRDEYLNKIEGRIKKLDDFIKSMLNYARVNRAEATVSEIDLVVLANTCIRELEYLENFKSVKTCVDIKNSQIHFKNDPLRLTIIFSNIISNAYKYYNPEADSYLQIKIDINPMHAGFEFKDNGIGIKKEHLNKIFHMFYRATERSQGSGLGMYIVKQAVEKLGGTIEIESEFGSGSTIRFTLPNL